jgi:transforming growth factor-beta-induced protein
VAIEKLIITPMKTYSNCKYLLLSAVAIAGILVSCEEDEFQNGLRISNLAESFASTGDIHRTAYTRANADGSLTSAFSAESLTGFLPTEQAYKNAGYINVESVSEGDVAPLKEIILYHVVTGARRSEELTSGNLQTLASGKNVTVGFMNNDVVLTGQGNFGGARVIATDAFVTNGYIHVTEDLLLPTQRKITDITVQNGYFDLLEAALIKTNLLNTFAGAGPFTIFAPGDAAFADYFEIPLKDAEGKDRSHSLVQAETLAALNAADPADLTELLNYHVVNGNLSSDDFDAGDLTTLDGRAINIELDDNGNLKSVTGIGNLDGEGAALASTPLQANVMGMNGVIHIVDRVLKPE